jgi:hypothetical protein
MPKPKANPSKLPRSRLTRRTRLRNVSVSMRAQLKRYSELRKLFLASHVICEICLKPKRFLDVHHKRGRGKHLLNTETWMAGCRECHRKIHDNPRWARANGYLID